MTTTSTLFPLGTVLFPGGYLPLQIFEVRYLDMVRKALRDDASFGVVTLSQGGEVRKPEIIESFSTIGTFAEIRTSTIPAPGLMQIQCAGTTRFRIESKEKLKHGLWVAQVFLLPDDQIVEVPDDLKNTVSALQALMQSWRDQQLKVAEMPLQPPYRFNDCGWVANRWAELLPLPAEEKLHLLALENPLLRLELIQDALQGTGFL